MFKAGIKYKTDKVTHHGYHRFYDPFIKPLRKKKFNLLEIGIDAGRSLRTWNDLFLYASIYGIDIGHEYEHDRGKIYKGDQSSISDLDNVLTQISTDINNAYKIYNPEIIRDKYPYKCRLIIDDGSHVPEHQLLTFNYLFDKCLTFGGVYIIEDIETSYWIKSELYGYNIDAGYKKSNNIVEIFKNIADIVNREFLLNEHIETIKKNSLINYENLKYISMITFGGNCIIINKMNKKDYERYGNRKYRFMKTILNK